MIVLDASVLIKCLLPEDGSDRALALVAEEVCVAPDLIINECVNALWKNARLNRITTSQAEEAVAILPALGLELVRAASLARRALDMAIVLGHPAYDCFYLALAEVRFIEMVTMDGAFARKVAASSLSHLPIRLLVESANEP